MVCRIADLRNKEVINSCNGCRIGFVDDVEVDTVTSQVKSIIVFGRPKCMGIMGRCDDIVVPWSDIRLIGEDTILVDTSVKCQQKKPRPQKYFG